MIYLFSIILFLIFPKISQAGFLDNIPNQACLASGQCGLDDISAGFVSIIELLLGALGAAALFYFIWGAIQWLTSGGNPERVKKGRDIMFGTAMAIFIALASYLFVNFFINDVLNVEPDYEVTVQDNECAGKLMGDRCGDQANNSVCTGDYFGNTCVSGCALYNAKLQVIANNNRPGYANHSLSCGSAPAECNFTPGNGYVARLCSGDTSNVCIMHQINQDCRLYDQSELNEINNYFNQFLLN